MELASARKTNEPHEFFICLLLKYKNRQVRSRQIMTPNLVAKGLEFYQERVPGLPGAMAQEKTTMVVRKAKSKKLLKGGDGPATKRPEGRPRMAELKELLRLLDVKLTYDPDRKEGTLEFSPFR